MTGYIVYLIDHETGAKSPIDRIVAYRYTKEMYIADCAEYADDDWNSMIRDNDIILEQED